MPVQTVVRRGPMWPTRKSVVGNTMFWFRPPPGSGHKAPPWSLPQILAEVRLREIPRTADPGSVTCLEGNTCQSENTY